MLFFSEPGFVFCHLCMAAKKTDKIGNTKVDGGFISDGFSNWKHGPMKWRVPQGGGRATGDASCHYA
ncbi:hypothetical protein DPMN_127663 [Dreissena polymorpha]|uniref:Uncharacterized protein n=1 Tax=Dreissena polymorpha TaxID=45954 RepID=A0A9D4JZD5_DREPO|nr:hypothetical protein DPMN_127663 [Dreissena polymorpha]